MSKKKMIPTKEWYDHIIDNCIKERQKYVDGIYKSIGGEVETLNKTIENLKIKKNSL